MLVSDMSMGGVIKVDPQSGKIAECIMGDGKVINFVTGAVQHKDKIYMVSLGQDKVVIVDA